MDCVLNARDVRGVVDRDVTAPLLLFEIVHWMRRPRVRADARVSRCIDSVRPDDVRVVREGATENAASCTALLTDMRDRGLRTDGAILAVIDGAKALAKAIRDVFGARALIQRCQQHKSRNVTDQLPEDMRPSVRQALRDAYGCADAARAKRMLTNLVRRLRRAPRRPRSTRASTRRSP